MNYPNVDTWERSDKENAYVYPDGKNVRMNLRKFAPNSSKRFREEDKEISDSLETFIIERGLFLKKIDVLCKYMDYFVEFFDTDKEFPVIMLHMKTKLDSNKESLTQDEFLTMIQQKFFRDTNIKRNIYRMVEANYSLDVTIDAKTGRVFNGPNDFTNEEVKRLLAISIFMKFIIPVASQYISTNTIYSKDELSKLLTKIFVDCFYQMGTYGEMDAEDLMLKLYIFTRDKILKHYGAHNVLWQQQCALRGLTESKHIDSIIIKHLLGNNMFKFHFQENVISFLKSIVETQLMCTINKVKYKVTPIQVSSEKDFNGLTSLDKLEQSMSKIDQGQVLRCEKSLADVVARLQEEWDIHPTEEEVEYYENNFLLDSPFHDMLFGYFYAPIFDGYIEISNMEIATKVDLYIIAKRKLAMDGYEQLPWLLTSVSKGKTTARLLQNAKFTNKLTTSADYINQMEKKYKALKGYRDDEILGIISLALNNLYTYVEYDHKELTGTEIEFDENVIGAEILRFTDSI